MRGRVGQGNQGVERWYQLKRGNIPSFYSVLFAIHQYQCCLYIVTVLLIFITALL